MNPRSLAFLRLTMCDKRKSILFSSFPKSGWNWTCDILEYCVTKVFLGDQKIEYKGEGTLKDRQVKPIKLFTPADSRSRNKKRIRDIFPQLDLDYTMHTHGFWKYSPLWGLDLAKTVFITRNIPTSLFSNFKTKSQVNNYQTFEEFLEKDGMLERIIKFYNTWGDFCQREGARFRIYKYEEMRDDPAPHFSDMYEFVFGVPVAPEVMKEALDFFAFEKQKEREFKFQKDEGKHFHFRGEKDYSSRIKPETLDIILRAIQKDLKHPFGYEYPEPS